MLALNFYIVFYTIIQNQKRVIESLVNINILHRDERHDNFNQRIAFIHLPNNTI